MEFIHANWRIKPDGSLLLSDIEAAIRSDDQHEPITRLVCLENTHNHCGGTVQTPETTRRIADFAHGRGLKVHLDGARIFNAAAALNVNVKQINRSRLNSVTFCLSKGLCAPVGSVLCGDKEFIKRAHRLRKMLGGGMRQAGILAAAGIIALEKMTKRLGEDHMRARNLAEGLSENREIVLDGVPQTNMVFFDLAPQVEMSTDEITNQLKESWNIGERIRRAALPSRDALLD